MDSIHTQVLAAFLQEGTHVDQLPAGPHKDKGVLMGDTFTSGVGYLRSKFPHPAIRTLMGLVWDIVGNKIIPIGIGPDLPSVSLVMYGSPETPGMMRTTIFLPHAWLDHVKQDPVLQMGALVFVGSQAVDAYNQRIVGQSEQSVQRARAYEAEFLLQVQKVQPEISLNDYQKRVIASFPQGLLSPAAEGLLYTSKPFERLS